MFQLPPALRALSAWRQFIVYRAVPSPTRPGKTDKFPTDWRTGHMPKKGSDGAFDPTIWLDSESAAAIADQYGPEFGVGFVFTENCGLFFIDLDECVVRDPRDETVVRDWDATAKWFMARFAGAAVEVSLSGRGLHIIGRGSAPKPRRIKSDDPAVTFDLYTESRFVALTGWSAVGDAGSDHTPALAEVTARWLSRPEAAQSEWTTTPCPEWRGPEDDGELLRRAMRSQSANVVFGGKARFADLWTADADVLARNYPDDHKQRAYGESEADAALAQHLAFWTGKDCERIESLMLQSALHRPKWDERDDYLRRTIINAVSRQRDVLQDKPPAPPPSAALPAPVECGTASAAALPVLDTRPAPEPTEGSRFLGFKEQIEFFRGCVYVVGLHRVLVPGGWLLKPEQFSALYGGYVFPLDLENAKIETSAWGAFINSQILRSPRADGTCFRPELPPAAIIQTGGARLANAWWPVETGRAEGDISPFLNHLAKLLPDERDRAIVLAYMAAVVQHPGVKFQWWPVLIGTPGNGKTFLLTALTECIGERYVHLPAADDLSGNGLKFTGWLQNKLFIGIEEIRTDDRRETLERLKRIVTNTRLEMQAKGQDQVTGDNRANGIACSNHPDAVPLDDDDRRWAVFYTGQMKAWELARDGMTGGYFPDLYDWFWGRGAHAGTTPGAHVINWFLHRYVIPAELNPARDLHRAPDTSSTAAVKALSVGAIEQEIQEQVDQSLPGFAGGWVSSMALDKLIARLRMDRRLTPRKRHDVLTGMGYVLHPALPGGRVNNPVAPDAGKPRLYIKPGSLLLNFTTPAAVADAYSKAQSTAAVSTANFMIDAPVNKA